MQIIKKYTKIMIMLLACIFLAGCKTSSEKTVKVGILHSQTGSMAISEKPVIEAELMAIDEINAAGGVLGHIIEPIIEDGKSDARIFGEKATKLITKDEVATIFGCWTSDSRKQVKMVVEEYYNLLWYPVQYEGMEASPNIMYTGACPNQQVVPAIDYCAEHFGNRMYLVGSDYVFPTTANRIIIAQLKEIGGVCVGEEYVPMDETNFSEIIEDIIKTNPDVIINTLNGVSNVSFFNQLAKAGITSSKIPVMSFSVSENEILEIGAENIQGNFVAWNYFETTDNNKNHKFVKDYKERYGQDKRIGDPVEAAYTAVYLWAAACEKAGTFDVERIRIAAKGLSYIAPEGMITIEGHNQHLDRTVRIGIVKASGEIGEIWSTPTTVRPDPYLSTYAWARGL